VRKTKFIKILLYNSILDDSITDCALWQSEENICDLKKNGVCDDSGYYYGTSDDREPKFCARHFYQDVVSGDGKTNYKLSI
jgi:hypothetical protein